MTTPSEAGRAGSAGTVSAPSGGRELSLVSGRRFGIVFAASAALNLVVPALGHLVALVPVLIGLLVVIAGFAALGRRGRSLPWVAVTYLAGSGTLAAFLLPGDEVVDGSTLATVTMLASLAIPSLLVAAADRHPHPALVVAAGIPVLTLAVVVTAPSGRAVFVALAVLGGWLAMSFAALWLTRSAAQVEAGVARLQQGYAAERRSTEAEAQLRYGARMLHDTVLATLSLVAHSGDGVAPATLRTRAGADSELLARLRTEGTLGPATATTATTAAEPAAAGTVPSTDGPPPARGLRDLVESRFAAAGFATVWHGAVAGDPSSAALDALASAVSECLENARRHSGESGAEVTISEDEGMVRAVVTDTGVGFDRDSVPRERLGLAGSVEARMHAVGGSARVFSSLGRGTTVLLEVPR
jgi:signal transduction histidine kinase